MVSLVDHILVEVDPTNKEVILKKEVIPYYHTKHFMVIHLNSMERLNINKNILYATLSWWVDHNKKFI
jgi:hypothetical protein